MALTTSASTSPAQAPVGVLVARCTRRVGGSLPKAGPTSKTSIRACCMNGLLAISTWLLAWRETIAPLVPAGRRLVQADVVLGEMLGQEDLACHPVMLSTERTNSGRRRRER